MPIDRLVKAVNLIPSDQRPVAKTVAAGAAPGSEPTPMGAYAILGALAFAVIAVTLLVLTNNSIAKNEAELVQAEQEAQVVETQASSLQSFADFKQLSTARTDTVTGLAKARFPWPGVLDDLSRAIPDDVYISTLDGSTITGETGGSGIRGAIQAPSIQLNGCTRNQASVARLMAQLRGVRGVTRVSLAKSTSPDESQDAAAPAPQTSADGTPASITTEPCPDGSPPAFDLVIFFERAVVSPNAAPNASAGGVAGPTGPTGPTGAAGATTTTSTPTTP